MKGLADVMDTILLVVPCKNEERAIPLFHEEVSRVFSTMPAVAFREIFVDDGSGDGTMDVLRGLAERDARVCYLSLSRNFGKEAALYAGLTAAVEIAEGRGGGMPFAASDRVADNVLRLSARSLLRGHSRCRSARSAFADSGDVSISCLGRV